MARTTLGETGCTAQASGAFRSFASVPQSAIWPEFFSSYCRAE
jgi:hypothetical protein